MWFLIIIFIAGIALSIALAIYEYDGVAFWFGLMITIIVSLFYMLFGALIGSCFEANEVTEVEEIPIVALSDNNNIEGCFFLGTGYVDSETYYYYLTENEDGGKKFAKIKADNAILYDNEKENPRVEITHARSSSWIANFFFITDQDIYSIYIPEGSIKYNFNVDLN